MIVIIGPTSDTFIPMELRMELVNVVLSEVEVRNDIFVARTEDLMKQLRDMKRNYAANYFEKIFGEKGLLSISQSIVRYVV